MTVANPVQYYDLSGGLVSYVSDDLLPSNCATLSINLNYDQLGDVTSRNGTAILGPQVSAGLTCDGLGQFITADKVSNFLVAAFGGTNYAYNGTAWSNIGGSMSAGTPVRYTSFLNTLVRVGGGSTTQQWAGSGTFSTGGIATGAPSGKYVMPYKQRLYIAGDSTYPNRLWFSTIATFGGSITWDTTGASTQYIDFTQGKANDVITGLGKISNLLVIFMDNAIYRWNGSSTDAEIVVDIGCSAPDSIIQAKGLLYFFNPTGIYSTDGTYPQEISRPINDWIQAISASNYSKIFAGADADHVYFFVGNVTLTKLKRDNTFPTGRTYNNVCLVYTISSKNWQVYSYANNLSYMATYKNTSGTLTLVSGDTLGNVLTLNSGTTDYVSAGNAAIFFEWESREEVFSSRAQLDVINGMSWFVDNGYGAQVSVSSEGKPYQTLGEISDRVTMFTSLNLRGHFFQFRLSGSNIGTPINFTGFEVFDVTNEGYVKLNV